MDVAELNDAIALERLRQIGYIDGDSLDLHLRKSFGKSVDKAEERHRSHYQSEELAPVAMAVEKPHTTPAEDTEQTEDKLRNRTYCHHHKPDVDEHRIAWQEVGLHRDIRAVGDNHESRQPEEHPLPEALQP